MLLRPPRLAFRGNDARTINTGLASDMLEHLVLCILEAPDPWRALEDVRRKLPVYASAFHDSERQNWHVASHWRKPAQVDRALLAPADRGL
jgi:hypothetical protein